MQAVPAASTATPGLEPLPIVIGAAAWADEGTAMARSSVAPMTRRAGNRRNGYLRG